MQWTEENGPVWAWGEQPEEAPTWAWGQDLTEPVWDWATEKNGRH